MTRSLLVPLTLLSTACAREPVIVVCLNANCVPPADVARDDTMEALRESLALQWHGRAAFDGMEIDTVWDASTPRCAFSYLFDTLSTAVDAHDAAAEIAAYLRRAGDLNRFYLKIQAKFRVAPDGRDPTQAELEAHCDCDLELAAIVEAAAVEVGRPSTVIFGEEPRFLAALVQRPGWPIEPPDDAHRRELMFKIRETPIGQARATAIAIEADALTGRDYASVAELADRGIIVQLWARHLTVPVMDAIDAIHPTIFDTNDVLSARLWVGPAAEGD